MWKTGQPAERLLGIFACHVGVSVHLPAFRRTQEAPTITGDATESV